MFKDLIVESGRWNVVLTTSYPLLSTLGHLTPQTLESSKKTRLVNPVRKDKASTPPSIRSEHFFHLSAINPAPFSGAFGKGAG